MGPTRMGLLRIRTEIFVGGAWVDISLHILNRQALNISWGRRDYASRVAHTKCSPQINNGGGRYSTRNPYSEYFGQLSQNTLIRQSVQLPDGTWEYLHHGEIASWPKRWDLSGNDSWMPVQTAGILRRLGQGAKPLKDSLRRHIEAAGPLLYWPLTDGETAIQGTELIQGSQPLRALGEAGSFYQGQPDWGKGTLAAWLDPVVQLPDETNGRITTRVPPRTLTGWSVDHVFAGGGLGFANNFEVWDNGPRTDTANQVEWIINTDGYANDIDLFVAAYGETVSGSTLAASIPAAGINDQAVHHLRLSNADDGAGGTSWWLYLDGNEVASGTRTTPFRPVQQLTYRWSLVDPGAGVPTEAMALGHVTYWGADAPAAIDTWRAVGGHVRERAGRRIERLCAERGVPLQVIGDLDQTPQMGPQKPGKFLDLLESAASVDGGAVHEARDTFGLAYRTNRSRYNQGL